MSAVPVLRSKLNVPQLPPAVAASERLQRLCGEMSERQTILITAPAGYGKTTLIVTAMNQFRSQGCRICWYRLTEEDRDLTVFYTHLTEALFPAEEGIWEEQRGYLSNCGDIYTQYQYINALFCQELWAFHNLHPKIKTFIAFDDFQQIMDTPDVYYTVQFIIDNLPDHCTVIVSSRRETGLNAGKRGLEQNILEITARDLRFSEEELAGLMQERYRLSPEPALLRKIMLHTEGWPAGIILICQMLKKNRAQEAGSILDRSDRKEMLFQYIVSEVLGTVDDRLLQFLVKAAILSEFTAAEAAAVFVEERAPQLLERCHQRGLFIQKIAGVAATYRFHSLFREALLQVQSRFLTPEEIKDYHLKAAAHYIEHRLFDRAIGHFILCGSIEMATELITRESVNLIAFGAEDQLRLWLNRLPDDVMSASGYLLYLKSYITVHRRPDAALQLLQQALAVFRQKGDRYMQLSTLVSMSQICAERNSVKGLRQLHKQAPRLSDAKQDDPLGWLLSIYDFAMAVSEENYARSETLLCRLQFQELTDEWRWMVSYHSAHLYCFLGDLITAESHIGKAMELSPFKKSEVLMTISRLAYSLILLLKDEQDSYLRLIEEITTAGEKHDYKYLLGAGKRLAAIANYRRHDLENAVDLLDSSTAFFAEIGNTAMAASNTLYRCLWLSRRHSVPELLNEAQKALRKLTTEPSGMCLREIGLSVFGAIAREVGDYSQAEKSLQAAVKKARPKARGTSSAAPACTQRSFIMISATKSGVKHFSGRQSSWLLPISMSCSGIFTFPHWWKWRRDVSRAASKLNMPLT